MRNLFFVLFILLLLNIRAQKNAFQKFILPGYELMDTLSGDLNLDGKNDLLIVLRLKNEEKMGDTAQTDLPRPLLLLINQKDGSYKQMGRNDHAVLCSKCGGVFGDPYNGLAIKNGYFSVQHYGGSNWRWTDIVTFKYDKLKKKWFLHKWGGDSYHTSDPDKVKTEVKTVKQFGVVEFDRFKR